MPRTLLSQLLFTLMALLVSTGATTCARTQSSRPESIAIPSDSTDLLNVIIPTHIPSQTKDYEGFRLSFNADNHTPNWVAWELTDNETDGANSRTNKFWLDTEIEGCPDTKDYTRSGYDRGHICPAADNKLTPQMMHDCFVMTNVCPQAHNLNAGAWKTLETKERLWANKLKKIVIVAGPIYDSNDTQRIGNTGVRVPSAFYKVIIAPYSDTPMGIGFIYPNMSSPGNMFNYAMTIDQVEEITGYDFFHNLPDDIENTIESTLNVKQWNKL